MHCSFHGATLTAAAECSRCEIASFLQSKATEEVYTPFAAIRYHLAFAPLASGSFSMVEAPMGNRLWRR